MYNGIGLATARGSGTNGYVQRNLAHAKQATRHDDRPFLPTNAKKTLDPSILLHEKKRKVELECMTFRVKLEKDGVQASEIEERVEGMRQRLLADLNRVTTANPKEIKEHEVHKLKEAKEREIARFQKALGIRKDHVEGEAFDRDVQEKRKEERMERRLERQYERDQRELDDAKASRRSEFSRRHSRSRSPPRYNAARSGSPVRHREYSY